jgi:hypothetical protein
MIFPLKPPCSYGNPQLLIPIESTMGNPIPGKKTPQESPWGGDLHLGLGP